MNPNLFRVCSAALCVVLVAGCNKKVSEGEVPGRYVAEYKFATETLELTSDRNFVQKITLKSSDKVATARGTWRFDSKRSDIYFTDSFMVVSDGFGNLAKDFDRPPHRATSILPVRSRFGRMQIGLDPAVPYKKIK
jgi:hypothetical protein